MGTRWNSTSSTTNTETTEKKYSPTTKKIVYGLAKMMGYYSTGSTAIKASHGLYTIPVQNKWN